MRYWAGIQQDAWVRFAAAALRAEVTSEVVRRLPDTRVAPSRGLDPHDGLGAALKGIIDGVADAFGLKDDRDPRVTWKLEQRRGSPSVYAVEIRIEPRAAGVISGLGLEVQQEEQPAGRVGVKRKGVRT